ncbi:TetR/AcrR family transcriptional regulator [Paucilactobacillus nenjiangensis]|uniref:TetR/AcrR family transcriptional regulator n=1 Tax=Paucilactobacillus nenjiangensis TaxID=1296540 RepID=UPI003BB72BDB
MDRRVVKTKRGLQEALFELLDQKSLADISVTELCERADIGRRTFYLHYDNIMEIFDDYLQDFSTQIESQLSHQPVDAETLLGIFNQIFSDYQSQFQIICLNHRQDALVNKLESMLFATLAEVMHIHHHKIATLKYITSGIINVYVYQINHPEELSQTELSYEVGKLLESDLTMLYR